VAAGGPTGPHLQVPGVIGVADINAAGGHTRTLILRVTAQAQIGIAGDQHLFIHRTVRVVTGGAAFTHRLVFKDERPRLLAMTLRTTFILPRHGQAAGRFENVAAVRVVAGHTAHVPFDDRMVLGQVEFRLDVEMTLKAGRGVLAGVDDEFGAAAGLDVFATGAVAGFAAGFAGHGRVGDVDPRVGTGREFPDDLLVAIQASLIADVVRAGNLQRHCDYSRRGGTGVQQERHAAARKAEDRRHGECLGPFQPAQFFETNGFVTPAALIVSATI